MLRNIEKKEKEIEEKERNLENSINLKDKNELLEKKV